MDLYLLSNIIVCVCAFAGFIFGATQFFRPKKALYGQMITLALMCIMLGRLFNIVRILSGGDLLQGFQIGFLGSIGSYLFFFSSNYGTLDTLVDDGSKSNRKYKIPAFLVSLIFLAMYVPLFLFGDVSRLWQIQAGVLIFFTAMCSYYHVKHLVFPDIDYGVVRSLRAYNFLALLYMMSSIAECYALSRANDTLTLIACCCSGVFVALMMPLTSRGLKRWKVRRAK